MSYMYSITSQAPQDLKHKHIIEKFNLKALEERVEYRINNPELVEQRNIVRRLKEKIIYIESYNDYLKHYVPVCKFQASDYCDKALNYNYDKWVTYGNCCAECTKVINKATVNRYTDYTPEKSKFTDIMEELATLDLSTD